MADQQQQHEQEQTQQTPKDQAGYDSVFSQLTSGASGLGFGPESAQQAWTAYWDLADQTLRTARRVSEVQTISFMRQQIVAEVCQQVISQIKRDPTLLKDSSRR